jgi:hypothetical protein
VLSLKNCFSLKNVLKIQYEPKYFAKQLVKVEISAENSSTDQRQTRGNPEDAKPWARTFYKRVARLHLIFRHRV